MTYLCDFLGGVGGDEDVLAALAVLAVGAHVQLQRHPLHALDAHVLRLEVLESLRKVFRLRILKRISFLSQKISGLSFMLMTRLGQLQLRTRTVT